jgi:nitrate/nitrite transporter NarK
VHRHFAQDQCEIIGVRLVHFGVGLTDDLAFEQLGDSDWWVLPLAVPPGSRIEYKLEVVDSFGTHLIPACHDYGIPQVRSAQLLAVMGIFDIVGTTASGWLTDRYSARYLLFGYNSLRGLSLLLLPATLVEGGANLGVFAVFYGLDWIATVPPTVKLTTEAFGRENTGVVYGWIGASHQLGASLAAFGAGAIRTELGDYRMAFLVAGALCLVAGVSFLTIGRRALAVPSAQPSPA